jgi:hypothetical protein
MTQRIYTKLVFDMQSPLPNGRFRMVDAESFEYDGPVSLVCGASHQQTAIEQAEANYYNVATQEAQQVFGEDQALFQKITSTFEPILEKDPNQQGFSQAELDTLNSSAITNTGRNYANAAKAVNEQIASQGGGNVFIPSGANNQLKEEVATSSAALTSQEENQIQMAGYQQGYDEFKTAEAALSGAGNVFSSASAFSGDATNAGNAAANTANQIAQEDNSWMGAIGGLIGTVGAGWASGGFKH